MTNPAIDPAAELDGWLTCWLREGVVGEFDRHWLELLARLDPQASPALLLAAALARAAIDAGHLCVELTELTSRNLPRPEGAAPPFPSPTVLRAELARSPLVTALLGADHPEALETTEAPKFSEAAPTPLVLEDNRLYLRRYQQYEKKLAAAVLRRSAPLSDPVPAPNFATNLATNSAPTSAPNPAPTSASSLIATDLPTALPALAAAAGITFDPEQQAAVLAALNHHLTVISGGPGTGKTTIIFLIMALLHQAAVQARQAPPRILLLAPTGKAAARLATAVGEQKARLGAGSKMRGEGKKYQGGYKVSDHRLADLPETAMTIHRALGYRAESPTSFRHRAANPLAADLVVVDEASMVDIALMSKLLAAVPVQARLILLGDKDQLASVEAGSILGDICAAAEQQPRLAPCVVTLSRGFRFDPARGIGALTAAIKTGDSEGALAVLHHDSSGQVALAPGANLEQDREFKRLLVEGFRPGLTAEHAAAALEQLNDFRLLCAHRRGEAGVEGLNLFCRRLLAAAGLIPATGEWYRGRPIMISANDYGLGLFNGDLGVIWDSPEDHGELRACFAGGGAEVRRILPSRLPRHETAFALTAHKSQGSEFGRVALILPREPSPILTRELLYTAISRARRQALIFGTEAVISEAISRKVERASGLAARLSVKPE